MTNNTQVFEQLQKLRGKKTLIVGIGNTLKGDDGAGPVICQQLTKTKINADIIDTATVPENYIQPIINKDPQNLIIIDAVDFGAPAGTVKIFKTEQLSSIVVSTHTLSPRLFIDMVCKEIQPDIYFIGIQPVHMQLGQEMSEQVSKSTKWLVDTLSKTFS